MAPAALPVGVEYLQVSLERTGTRVRLWPATGFTLVQLLILEGFGGSLFLISLCFSQLCMSVLHLGGSAYIYVAICGHCV